LEDDEQNVFLAETSKKVKEVDYEDTIGSLIKKT
jgi:hypothetical protein